jgi:hypothetical protein
MRAPLLAITGLVVITSLGSSAVRAQRPAAARPAALGRRIVRPLAAIGKRYGTLLRENVRESGDLIGTTVGWTVSTMAAFQAHQAPGSIGKVQAATLVFLVAPLVTRSLAFTGWNFSLDRPRRYGAPIRGLVRVGTALQMPFELAWQGGANGIRWLRGKPLAPLDPK